MRSSSFSSLRCVSRGLKENPPLSSEDAHSDKNPSTDRKAKSWLAKCCSDKAPLAAVIKHKDETQEWMNHLAMVWFSDNILNNTITIGKV